MADSNPPDAGASFNVRGDRDSAVADAREKKLDGIRQYLQNAHANEQTPVSVSRIEEEALGKMAQKPTLENDIGPGSSTVAASNREIEQRRQDRVQAIRDRLAQQQSIGREFGKGGDGYDP